MLLTGVVCLSLGIALACWIVTDFGTTKIEETCTSYLTTQWRFVCATTASLLVALVGFRTKNLSQSGAISTFILLSILGFDNLCFFTAAFVFLATASKATEYRRKSKAKLRKSAYEGPNYNWTHVVCNFGVAAELAIFDLVAFGGGERCVNFAKNYKPTWLCMAILGSLANAAGDNLASEIGMVVGKTDPTLITTWKKVPPGTNGGVTIAGTIGSAIGGFIVAAAYFLSLTVMSSALKELESPPQWPLIIVGTIAGLLGSFIDSILGATLQYSGYCSERKKVVDTPGPTVTYINGSAVLSGTSIGIIASVVTSMVTPAIASWTWSFTYLYNR